jgi:hypothetical protein
MWSASASGSSASTSVVLAKEKTFGAAGLD